MENLIEINKPQAAGMVQTIIGLAIGIVMLFSFALPVTSDAISNAGLDGTNETIAMMVITLIVVVPVVWVANMF